MSQLFPRSANTIARLSLVGLALAIPIFIGLWALYNASSANTNEGKVIEQPIAFSHQIHAGRLQLDCRYCHTSVQNSPFAGMPTTEQCMTCHSQVAQGLPDIAKLQASLQTGIPIAWERVYVAAGLRLLRSQRARQQRRRLRDLSRAGGRDADRLPDAAADDAVVPRLSP